jgi:hypothetical protein
MKIRPRAAVLVCAAAISMMLVEPAKAGRIGEGTIEFQGSGSFDHERVRVDGNFVGSITQASMSLGLATGITDMLMLGGSILFDYASLDPESGASYNQSVFRFTGDVILNFPVDGSLVPFVQSSIGLINWSATGESDVDMTLVLPFVGGGFRVLMGDHASFNVAAGFEYQARAQGDADTSAHDFVVRFGLSAFPKGLQ